MSYEDDYEPGEIIMLVPGREAVEGDPIPNGLRNFYKLAQENGWNAHLGYSRTLTHQKPFASGQKAGEEREDVYLNQTWLDAHKEGKGIIHIIYWQINDKDPVCYRRSINRTLENPSHKEMRAWITSDNTD